MTNKRNIALVVAVMMACLAPALQAQQVEVAFEDGALSQYGFRSFLGVRNNQLYVLQGQNNPNDAFGRLRFFEFRLTGKLPLLLVKYDRQMKVQSKAELKFTPPKGTTIGFWEGAFLNDNGEIYVFYSAREDQRDALFLFACVYDNDGKVIVDSRPIDAIQNATRSTFQLSMSPDTSLFQVYKTVNQYFRVVQFSYRIIPESLTQIIHQNTITPSPELLAGGYYPVEAVLNDSGSVVIPVVIDPNRKEEKQGVKEAYVSILSYDYKGKQELVDLKLGESISINRAMGSLDQQQRFVFVGNYKLDKGEKSHQGIALISFDMEKQEVSQFEIHPLLSVFPEGSKEAKRHLLAVRRIWWNADGSGVVLLEHDVNSSIEDDLWELREAYVVGLNPDRSLKYVTKVDKAQNSREYAAFNSVSATYDGSTVYLLWNDHPDNLPERTRTANIDNRASLVPVIAAVDAKDGTYLGRKQAFEKSFDQSRMLVFSTWQFRKQGNEVGIYASDGKTYRIGWATFKR